MIRTILCASLLACGVVHAQDLPPVPAKKPTAATTTTAGPSTQTSARTGKDAKPASPVRYRPERFAGRAGKYYPLVWGVDSLTVKWAESGEMIRFSYRVLDPEKAAVLNNERSEPSLIAPSAGVSLVVPTMENVGRLRQTARPEEGKTYWMAFANKGRLVKRGDRVIVEIGKFRANGLVVD